MSLTEHIPAMDHLDPIDIVEHLAEHNDWDFDRIADDQIAMVVEGRWRTYSITLAWSAVDETLRLVATFEMEPPEERMDAVHELLNLVNDRCWTGAFTYWAEQKLVVWRYGLLLAGEQNATPEQIDRMIGSAVQMAERFYPAFQLAAWGNSTPGEAMQAAIAEAYGRA